MTVDETIGKTCDGGRRERYFMKFSVGLQFTNEALIQDIILRKEQIHEVYFSWGDFPNGRSSALISAELTPWELQEKQMEVLKKLSEEGIGLNLLFNATCYGKDSQSRAFFEKVGMTVDYIAEKYGLQSVTTTSPLIAKFLKQNFPEIDVRASVNMEIGTVQGMDYLAEYFDSYYIKRECNRDLEQVKVLHQWAAENGKKLYLLANSGCLNHCSAHMFHDNLVAHEAEIAGMDNAYAFQGMCREYLKKEENYKHLITDTNFIRPEDIYQYEPYVEAVKLATRVNKAPCQVLRAYMDGRFSGNILNLLEPAHSIYPYVLENGDPLKLVKLEG